MFLAPAVSLVIIVPALAQTSPPGMTMHRIQAGEPDASGWLTAASTEGGFSVRLPLRFNDFTLLEPAPKAPTLRTFTVGAKSQKGIKFSATRIVYRKGGGDIGIWRQPAMRMSIVRADLLMHGTCENPKRPNRPLERAGMNRRSSAQSFTAGRSAPSR